MILANIATEADLANGTRGTVTDIILDHREPLEHEERDGAVLLRYPPAIVYFKPDGETRVRLEGFPDGLLPIVPQEGKFVAAVNEKKTCTILRRQLALTPGYAFTDLKGQGQTIEYVIVDLARPNYGSKLDAFGFDESLFVSHPSPELEAEDARLAALEVETTEAWRAGSLWNEC
ncbi:hypothetical protein GG344DRAFT_75268 [Lentinula edodes]|nr:hypothetical protein GG344DRAFT_75268 [Lentinula edodes]